ncbi:hypothetical protein ATANTOWER_014603 [Ataeniobius toweri]|uniref:Uncharacterized protein n=1 Tax=Ataeniobius toweri TaxID=208326 RepID=A0ABU7BTU9_9TELE|nr:hypothetical protein [Ataeniobius toweri]
MEGQPLELLLKDKWTTESQSQQRTTSKGCAPRRRAAVREEMITLTGRQGDDKCLLSANEAGDKSNGSGPGSPGAA